MQLCFTSAVLLLTVLALPIAASAQTPGKRLPPPSAEQLAAAKKLVAEVYRNDYTKASTPALKLALAGKLIEDARQTKDDPTSKYAMLLIARDIAAGAGDWEACLQAIVPLAETFHVDAFALADEARVRMDLGDKPLKDPLATFRLIMDLAEAAVQKDRYDIAGRLASAAQRLARDGKDPLTTKQLAEYVTDLQKRARQFEALEPQLTRLAADPTDAEANLAVGRFRALEQNRWREGIALLALSSDAELAKLAGRELAEPTAAVERIAIADAWWELADARKADAKALRRHAADCDLRVLPNLAGLTKKKVEARLAEIEKWHSKDATYTVHPATKGEDDRRYPPLPTLLNNVDKFHNAGTEFAFHIADRYAHIIIDLKKEVAVSRLHILNRESQGDRARNMRVYLSNSPGSQGEQIWQAPDGAAEWNVVLNRLYVGRYLVITRDFNSDHDAFLHLRKVKVFGPE